MRVKVPSLCLACGATLDGAAGIGNAVAPSPGSISLCVYCGALAIYGDDLRLRAATAEEMADIEGDPDLWATLKRASRAIHFYRASKN